MFKIPDVNFQCPRLHPASIGARIAGRLDRRVIQSAIPTDSCYCRVGRGTGKALLRVVRRKKRASMSVHTRVGARTKEAEFAVMHEQGSQLWIQVSQVQSYHAEPGSRGALPTKSESMLHIKPRPRHRGQSARRLCVQQTAVENVGSGRRSVPQRQ
jgi:hypothetical protein